jgi:alkanesulfonate monooxygenase SsuD/methylene tetrahydromethanopterin reductase-like flavin-dependent oxidoreductase (luciferase family)
VGEGPTWDAFVLATAIGVATEGIGVVGPVPVSVRYPVIARGAAGVANLAGRPITVALGTSSTRVVEGVNGRSRARSAK